VLVEIIITPPPAGYGATTQADAANAPASLSFTVTTPTLDWITPVIDPLLSD
jgi:hypothetical protein